MTTIEDLNKTQLILLTLLICFVVSIATGIITFSLLSEAPVNITQTIDRVVEKTIEKAVPVNTPGGEVKLSEEAKAAVALLEKATQATVRVNAVDLEGKKTFVSMGVVASQDGLVVTSKGKITQEGSYIATFSDDTSVPLTLVRLGENEDIAVFKIETAAPTATTTPASQ